MSREIKFRAWDKEFHTLLLPEEWAMPMIQPNGSLHDDFGYPLKDDDYIIEQYTGLKDKNGKEIYEGDLIKVSDAPVLKDKTLVVKFGGYYIGEYCCAEMSGWLVRVVNSDWAASLLDEVDRCEVIGNIHENPELVGDEE